MEERGLDRSDLAKLLGRTKGWVTQLLDGEKNKTIRTVAHAFAVMGAQFETSYSFPSLEDRTIVVEKQFLIDFAWTNQPSPSNTTVTPKMTTDQFEVPQEYAHAN